MAPFYWAAALAGSKKWGHFAHTNPPAGAGVASRVVRRLAMLNPLHYDKPSLFAGKLHAVLNRKCAKGRNLYDLVWYLSDPTWPSPNLTLLNNALRQAGCVGTAPAQENWREVVSERLRYLDWKQAARDVMPFLERERDIEMITPEILHSLLSRGHK